MAGAAAKFERTNPDTLRATSLFSKVVTVEGGKTVYVSGMTSTDVDGNLVGEGDLAAQAVQVYENIRLALAAVGSTPGNVVRQRVFIVDVTPDKRGQFIPAMNAFYGDGERGTSTLVGALPAGTPPIVLALLDFDAVRLPLRNHGLGHDTLPSGPILY